MFRIGHGYDVHKLCEGRDLYLGGVKIPHELGLLGHSDADVLLHALCDALLGAMGLGDIGKHFPDTDDKYKGISSVILLENVAFTMENEGYVLGNCDVTVDAQKPKLAPYIPEMRKIIARTLSCDESSVNVKATTEEHLGFTGRCEGISAHAVALIYKK
ncbi:MAG: 2-C-methyl-D-erythritol 2,4-cyclodiphosphate synthase [Clostridia bacterium]|nr:2-C-methyl-D-erythritol 2,4-cyclodiphosphate synthase [Clostridia bacterium]